MKRAGWTCVAQSSSGNRGSRNPRRRRGAGGRLGDDLELATGVLVAQTACPVKEVLLLARIHPHPLAVAIGLEGDGEVGRGQRTGGNLGRRAPGRKKNCGRDDEGQDQSRNGGKHFENSKLAIPVPARFMVKLAYSTPNHAGSSGEASRALIGWRA